MFFVIFGNIYIYICEWCLENWILKEDWKKGITEKFEFLFPRNRIISYSIDKDVEFDEICLPLQLN